MRVLSACVVALVIGCGGVEAPGTHLVEAEPRTPEPTEAAPDLETHLSRTCGSSEGASAPEQEEDRCAFEIVAQQEVGQSGVRAVAIVKLVEGLSQSESHHLFVLRDAWRAGPLISDGPFIGNQMVGTIHYSITDVALRASSSGAPPVLFASFRQDELVEDSDAGTVESTSEGTLICGDFAARPRCTAIRLRVHRRVDDLEEIAESRLVIGERNEVTTQPVRGGLMGQVATFQRTTTEDLLARPVWPPRSEVDPPADEFVERAAAMAVLRADAAYAVWQVVDDLDLHPTDRPPRVLSVDGVRIVTGAETGISFSYGVSRLRGSRLDVYGARGRVCQARVAGWFFLTHEHSGIAEDARADGLPADWEGLDWDTLRPGRRMIAARLEAVEGECTGGLWARDSTLGPVEVAAVRPLRGGLVRRAMGAFRRGDTYRQLVQDSGPEEEWAAAGDGAPSPRSRAASFRLGGKDYVVLVHEAFPACVGLSAVTVLFERSGADWRELGHRTGSVVTDLPAAAAAIHGDAPQLIFTDRLWHVAHPRWRYVPFADQPC